MFIVIGILFIISSTIPIFIPDTGDLCLFPFSIITDSSASLLFFKSHLFVFSLIFSADKLSLFLYV